VFAFASVRGIGDNPPAPDLLPHEAQARPKPCTREEEFSEP
jgi:hypothetical protein